MANIIIAEDEAGVREFVSRALAMDGHAVTVAEDGLEALDRLGQDRYGIALALKAGSEWPDMRILLMSGYAAERQRAHNLDALVHRVISKPFSLADIRKAVQETLRKQDANGASRRPGLCASH
jgi:CheY-like chemotaxis protein